MINYEKKIQTWLVVIMMVLAPLAMNQYSAIALMGGVFLGALLILFFLWNAEQIREVSNLHIFFIAASILLVSIYILPIPNYIWELLPNNAYRYEDVRIFLGNDNVPFTDSVVLSIIPVDTIFSLYFLIPVLAVFLVANTLPKKNINIIIYVFLTIVLFQAVIGVIQYAVGSEALYMGKKHGNNANGTYSNRDHYVAIFEFSVPILLGMLLVKKNKNSKIDDFTVSARIILLFILVFSLVAGILSGSRTGIALLLLGMVLAGVLSLYKNKSFSGFGYVLFPIFASFIALFQIGIIPVLNRFAKDPLEDGRWVIFENTKKIINDHPVFGTGPGTFSDVYRAYQPVEQPKFINHVHNDYLQLISEMGYFGILIITFFFFMFLYQSFLLFRNRRLYQVSMIQVASGVSVLLLLLHSSMDFNLHILANAIFFAFFLGVFFRKVK